MAAQRWRIGGGPAVGPAEACWRLCSSLVKVCRRPGGSPAVAFWRICSGSAEAQWRSDGGLAETLQWLGRGQTEVHQSLVAAVGVLVAAQVACNKGWD